MLQRVIKIIKWATLPVLLIVSMFSIFAARYEVLLNAVICLGAIIVVQRAVWLREYFWAAGFVGIAVVFSPLGLVIKIFLLMGFACLVTFGTLWLAWKKQRVPVG